MFDLLLLGPITAVVFSQHLGVQVLLSLRHLPAENEQDLYTGSPVCDEGREKETGWQHPVAAGMYCFSSVAERVQQQ